MDKPQRNAIILLILIFSAFAVIMFLANEFLIQPYMLHLEKSHCSDMIVSFCYEWNSTNYTVMPSGGIESYAPGCLKLLEIEDTEEIIESKSYCSLLLIGEELIFKVKS